jgi:hypothetical protein
MRCSGVERNPVQAALGWGEKIPPGPTAGWGRCTDGASAVPAPAAEEMPRV